MNQPQKEALIYAHLGQHSTQPPSDLPEDWLGRIVITEEGERLVIEKIWQWNEVLDWHPWDENYPDPPNFIYREVVAKLIPEKGYTASERLVSRDRLAQWVSIGVWRIETE